MASDDLTKTEVSRRQLKLAAQRLAGSIDAESHPEWATDADVVAWARAIRADWERDPYRQVARSD